jgi:hypothetical protein
MYIDLELAKKICSVMNYGYQKIRENGENEIADDMEELQIELDELIGQEENKNCDLINILFSLEKDSVKKRIKELIFFT